MSVPLPLAPVLLAAGIDWLEGILPLLFVGFWIVSQLAALFRRVAAGPARPPVIRMPDPVARPDRPAAPEMDPRVELERQIEEFLRGVTGQGAADPPPRPVTRQERGQAGRRPTEIPRSRPVASEPRPTPPAAGRGDRRARSKDTQHERRVGGLGTAPSDVARHVHDAFAHDLGHLHSGLESPAEAAEKADTALPAERGGFLARDLVRAARDPATIRRAILLREILERPVDRW